VAWGTSVGPSEARVVASDGSEHRLRGNGDSALGVEPSNLGLLVPSLLSVRGGILPRWDAGIYAGWFGEGASARGDAHEAMTLAGVKRLPMVFICDNNQFAYSTPSSGSFACKQLSDRGPGYGIPGRTVDGTRVLEVYAAVREAIDLLSRAERPVVIAGSGVWWSDGAAQLQAFVEATGIPFYTTPISRGLIAEDHELAFLNARSKAFTEADVVLAVGTRFNWVIQFGRPPRFAADLKVIHVDINPTQLGHNRQVDVPIAGDARAVLEQLRAEAEGKITPKRFAPWTGKLRTLDAEKGAEQDKAMSREETPIHPLRLCKEIRDFMRRDGILVVDGQEILNFGRQAIPTYVAGHRLNSGAFGTMGVGLPFGVGAKVAKPDAQVLVLHGDGSYGINAMEIDTAVRHRIPVVVVISNNGGWTADAPWTRPLPKPGRNLGHTRYDRVAQELGAHGEYVEKPHDIRPALERAFASGKPAVVNVITDSKARAQTVRFSAYTT